jgi:hypothetical protein
MKTFTELTRTPVAHNLFDSGDYYGRNYTRPIETEVTIDVRHNEYLDEFDITASIPTGAFLDAAFTIDKELTKVLKTLKAHTLTSRDAGLALAKKLGLNVYEETWENTYNYETDLDQVFQYFKLKLADGSEIYIIETHNGCDVRGGYSQCVVARPTDPDEFFHLEWQVEWCVGNAYKNGKQSEELLETYRNYDYSSDLNYILRSQGAKMKGAIQLEPNLVKIILDNGDELEVYAISKAMEYL